MIVPKIDAIDPENLPKDHPLIVKGAEATGVTVDEFMQAPWTDAKKNMLLTPFERDDKFYVVPIHTFTTTREQYDALCIMIGQTTDGNMFGYRGNGRRIFYDADGNVQYDDKQGFGRTDAQPFDNFRGEDGRLAPMAFYDNANYIYVSETAMEAMHTIVKEHFHDAPDMLPHVADTEARQMIQWLQEQTAANQAP